MCDATNLGFDFNFSLDVVFLVDHLFLRRMRDMDLFRLGPGGGPNKRGLDKLKTGVTVLDDGA